MKKRQAGLPFIIVTIFLDVLGFGLLIPVGPRLVQALGGGTEAEAAPIVGMLMSTYAILQFFFAPVLGALSDHFGRRPVILTAMLGSGLDYFVMAFSPNLWVLFITRAINGLTGASMTPANAYIADVTPPEKRAAAFGLVGAAFGAGFVFGPLVGGLLGEQNIRYPFYAAGAVSLINWLYGYFILPESLAIENRTTLALGRISPIAVFKGLGRYPLVVELAASFFLLNLAQFALHATWVLYTAYRYGWSPFYVGMSLFAVGISAVIVQGGLTRKLIPILGEAKALLIGVGIAVLAYIGYGAATQGWMIYCAIGVGSLAGIAQPAAQSMITRTVRPDEQGRTQGALTALQNIASIAGPLIGTSVFAYSTSGPEGSRMPGATFYVAGIMCALGWLVAAWAVSRHAGRVLASEAAPEAVQQEDAQPS